jgi:hypothetical protein
MRRTCTSVGDLKILIVKDTSVYRLSARSISVCKIYEIKIIANNRSIDWSVSQSDERDDTTTKKQKKKLGCCVGAKVSHDNVPPPFGEEK